MFSLRTRGNVEYTWGHVRAGHYIIVTIISGRHVVARTEDGGEIGDTLITFVLHTEQTTHPAHRATQGTWRYVL